MDLQAKPSEGSVLDLLSASLGDVPRVLLRDTALGETPSPLIQPNSPEMPAASNPGRLQVHGEIARGGTPVPCVGTARKAALLP